MPHLPPRTDALALPSALFDDDGGALDDDGIGGFRHHRDAAVDMLPARRDNNSRRRHGDACSRPQQSAVYSIFQVRSGELSSSPRVKSPIDDQGGQIVVHALLVGQCGAGQNIQTPSKQAWPLFRADQDVGVVAERALFRLFVQPVGVRFRHPAKPATHRREGPAHVGCDHSVPAACSLGRQRDPDGLEGIGTVHGQRGRQHDLGASEAGATGTPWLHCQPRMIQARTVRVRCTRGGAAAPNNPGRVSRPPAMPPLSDRGRPRSSSSPLLLLCRMLTSRALVHHVRSWIGAIWCGSMIARNGKALHHWLAGQNHLDDMATARIAKKTKGRFWSSR